MRVIFLASARRSGHSALVIHSTRLQTIMIVLLATFALPTCSGGDQARDTPRTIRTATVRCSDAIFERATVGNPNLELIGDGVGLQTSTGVRDPLQMVPQTDNPNWPALRTKTGLAVRSGTTASITVVSPTDVDLSLFWSNDPARPSQSVSISPCSSSSEWLIFAGGYYTSKPTCGHLRIVIDGKEFAVAVPVGAPC